VEYLKEPIEKGDGYHGKRDGGDKSLRLSETSLTPFRPNDRRQRRTSTIATIHLPLIPLVSIASAPLDGIIMAKPIEVAFPLPRAPQTNIHLQLTDNQTSIVAFFTTTTSDSATSAPMGSFVYAMPNVNVLHTSPPSPAC
jgi:hypothetical protein